MLMRYAHTGLIVGAALLLVQLSPAPMHASGFDRLTYFTFSGPVQVPGGTLPAGTYEFRIVNADTGSSVMRVASVDDPKMSKLFFMNRGIQLDHAPNDPIVILRETPPGVAPALDAWVYPGEEQALAFQYSHKQAAALSAGARTPVTTTAAATRIAVGSHDRYAIAGRTR
jgi:hypothetical protein